MAVCALCCQSGGSTGNCYGQGLRGVPLVMSRILPEYPDSNPSDRSVLADVFLRQQPDEEEEEEDKGDGKDDDDDDDQEGEDDEGYSE
jgi:hypothetical protein